MAQVVPLHQGLDLGGAGIDFFLPNLGLFQFVSDLFGDFYRLGNFQIQIGFLLLQLFERRHGVIPKEEGDKMGWNLTAPAVGFHIKLHGNTHFLTEIAVPVVAAWQKLTIALT